MTTLEMKARYNELMRIAKGDEYMSMVEFEELLALSKKLAKQHGGSSSNARSIGCLDAYPIVPPGIDQV